MPSHWLDLLLLCVLVVVAGAVSGALLLRDLGVAIARRRLRRYLREGRDGD